MTETLRERAERAGTEMTARGYKVIRADGELLISSKGANEILGRGRRYLETLRYHGHAPTSVQFTPGTSAHHFYRIIDLLGIIAIDRAA